VSAGQITHNGLTMGADTDYRFTRISGLIDTPGVRTSDEDRARRHGQLPGDDYAGGRSIQASIKVEAEHPSDAWTLLSQALVIGLDETPMLVEMPGLAGGRQVLLYARVRNQKLVIDHDYMAVGLGFVNVDWWCTDPRIYDAALTSLATTMATLAGTGRSYPRSYPLSYGGAVSAGLVTATNEGEFPAPWEATIVGPVGNPRIENVTTGETVAFTGSLAAGEELVIGSDLRSVLLDGTASRYSWLTRGSEWFDVQPGANEIRLAGTSGSGSMTFNFRSAWI
jgi:hypothetical protein